MSGSNVVTLARWNSEDAVAVSQQLLSRVMDAIANGRKVGIAAVLVTQEEDGVAYEPCYSVMPSECVMWASDKLRRHIVGES